MSPVAERAAGDYGDAGPRDAIACTGPSVNLAGSAAGSHAAVPAVRPLVGPHGSCGNGGMLGAGHDSGRPGGSVGIQVTSTGVVVTLAPAEVKERTATW